MIESRPKSRETEKRNYEFKRPKKAQALTQQRTPDDTPFKMTE